MKVYGPIRAPGVQVREIALAAGASASPFGTSLLVGTADGGPVGEVIEVLGGRAEFRSLYGDPDVRSQLGQLGAHFYDASTDAAGNAHGRLWVLRVASSDADAAGLQVYDRHAFPSLLERAPAEYDRNLLFNARAYGAGRWAGRQNRRAGDIDLSTAVTDSVTVELGVTDGADYWRDAVLTFPDDDPSFSVRVQTIDADGTASLVGPLSAAVIAGTGGRFSLSLNNDNAFLAATQELGVEWRDGDASTRFALSLTQRPSGATLSWPALSLDEQDRNYVIPAVDERERQWWLRLTDVLPTVDPDDALSRPANYAEIAQPGGLGTTSVTLQTVRWTRSGTGNPYLDTINDFAHGSDAYPCTIVCTFNAATTFTVSVTGPTGLVLAATGTLPSGTLGTAWAPPHPWLPTFTLRAGATAAISGTTVTLQVRPLPADLAALGGRLYLAAGPSEGDTSVWYPVVSNTADTVTVGGTQSLDDEIDVATAPTVAAGTAGPFVMAGSDTFIYSVGGSGPFTLTSSLGAGSKTAAATFAELNARELARVSGVASAKLVEFSLNEAGTKVVVTALQDFGSAAVITIGAGTMNSILGFSEGDTAGTDGQILRLQYQEPMHAGWAGTTPNSAVYTAAIGPGGDLEDMIDADTGGITCAVPYEDPVVQRAMASFAERVGGLAIGLIPAALTGDAEAVAWWEAQMTSGSFADHVVGYHPSYGDKPGPNGGAATYPFSLQGYILGLFAKTADTLGPQVAVARNDRAAIAPYFKRLSTGTRRIDDELINGYGLNEVRARGSQIYLWGDRIRTFTVGEDGTQRGWVHFRRAVGHIARQAMKALGPIVFEPNNDATRLQARRLARSMLLPYWRASWFDDSNGPSFEQQVRIVCDASNNPSAERAAGNLHIEISFRIVGVAERVVLTLDPNGVTESTGGAS